MLFLLPFGRRPCLFLLSGSLCSSFRLLLCLVLDEAVERDVIQIVTLLILIVVGYLLVDL